MWRAAACVILSLALGVACGAHDPRPSHRADTLDLEGWGEAPASPVEAPSPAARTEGAVELARGERLASVVALTHTPGQGGGEPRCALYSLRAGSEGLEEGRAIVACPSDGLASLGADRVPHALVEQERSTHLRAALAGAGTHPSAHRPQQGEDGVLLRLVTDRGELEALVAQPPWPAPWEVAPPPRRAPPADLGEVWEALMFPERWAAL